MRNFLPKAFFNTKPDYNNYSFFGKDWKDRANGVTELSAKVGTENRPLTDPRPEPGKHQINLLKARLNAFVDAISTPVVFRKEAIKVFDLPVLHVVLPSLRDARIGSMKSFNETKAFNRVLRTYEMADGGVRTEFFHYLSQEMDKHKQGSPADRNLQALLNVIGNGSHFENIKRRGLNKLGVKHEDKNSIHPDRLTELQSTKVKLEEKFNDAKAFSKIGAFITGKNRNLRRVDRQIAAIENPSSYERHIASGDGSKVSNRSLYVEELKNRAKSSSTNPVAPADGYNTLKTRKDIRDFTADKFDEFAIAINAYQNISVPSDEDKAKLLEVARPILYSKDRHAVHRFVRDMKKQLKRAGVTGEEFEKLDELIPQSPAIPLKVMQTLFVGSGKQMRLQDKAKRMEMALIDVLALAKENQKALTDNLMHFNLAGVNALKDYLSDPNNASTDAPKEVVDFLRSAQGKSLVNEIVNELSHHFGAEHPDVKALKKNNSKMSFGLKQSHDTVKLCLDDLNRLLLGSDIPEVFKHLINAHQNIFMESSDSEFWDRESVGKVATRLNEVDDDHKNSRIFKQMKMRAAALNMQADTKQFMVQGIQNTLRNRNMAVEGSKLGGAAGAAIANAMSTPLTVPAMKVAPFLAFPGILDSVLMPIGWTIGLAPGGAIGGSVMGAMKKQRLAEAENSADAIVPSNVSTRRSTEYTSASKTLFSRTEITKSSAQPLHITAGKQFSKVHGSLWTEIAKETGTSFANSLTYVFKDGPRNFLKDMVVHGELKSGATVVESTESHEMVAAPPGPSEEGLPGMTEQLIELPTRVSVSSTSLGAHPAISDVNTVPQITSSRTPPPPSSLNRLALNTRDIRQVLQNDVSKDDRSVWSESELKTFSELHGNDAFIKRMSEVNDDSVGPDAAYLRTWRNYYTTRKILAK